MFAQVNNVCDKKEKYHYLWKPEQPSEQPSAKQQPSENNLVYYDKIRNSKNISKYKFMQKYNLIGW